MTTNPTTPPAELSDAAIAQAFRIVKRKFCSDAADDFVQAVENHARELPAASLGEPTCWRYRWKDNYGDWLLGHYKAIGPVGTFGALMIEQVLQRADQAAASGDIIAMLRSYEQLKGCE